MKNKNIKKQVPVKRHFFVTAAVLIAFSSIVQGCYFFCFLKADKDIEQSIEGFLEEKVFRETGEGL